MKYLPISRIKLISALCIATLLLPSPILHAQATPPSNTEPLGIALESYPYPYPVKFLSLELEGQPVRMAYMDVAPAGAPNGQTALLLHGKNFYGNSWGRVIGVLTQAGYRVVAPDQIGFGKSSKPDIDYSFDMLAANTAKLLDTLDVKQSVVIGHSTGGMPAVRFGGMSNVSDNS